VTGGPKTYCMIGTADGSMSPFQWGHLDALKAVEGDSRIDPGNWNLLYDCADKESSGTGGRGAIVWENSLIYYTSMYFAGGRSSLYAGSVSFDNLWYGTSRNVQNSERRIAS
jgi:hypothetical protein